jgi:hypothetical protein
MRFNILSDADWEARIDKVLDELSDLGYRQHFEQKNYGSGMYGVTVVFMCLDKELGLKKRIKLVKSEKKLYMDIMLDLSTLKSATPEARKREVAQRLYDEVPEVLAKYKIPDFNRDAFVADFRAWIDGTGWR